MGTQIKELNKAYQCECGKIFHDAQRFNGHKSNCEIHLKSSGKYEQYLERRARGYQKTKETNRKIAEANRLVALSKWISEEHTCEKCGKVMTEKFGSGRFCSKSCANSRQKTKSMRIKASNTQKKIASTKKALSKKIYLENPSLCQVCGKPLDYEHRKRKVCSKHCQNELERVQKIQLCKEQGTNLCGKGKRGYYKGFYCQSSWELAYVIFQLDHNVAITRNKCRFGYVLDGVERSYFPDFYLIDSDTYVEVKGYYDRKTKEKEKQFPIDKKLIVLTEKEMKPILEYVINKYGKDFTRLYWRDGRAVEDTCLDSKIFNAKLNE